MGVPQNRWFVMEHPIKWMMTGGTPIYGNLHISHLRKADVLVCNQCQGQHRAQHEHHGHGVSRALDLLDLSTGSHGFKDWLLGKWMALEHLWKVAATRIIQLLHIISDPCLISFRVFQHLLFPQATGFCCSSMCFLMPCLVHRVFATGLQPSASQLFDNHQRYVCGWAPKLLAVYCSRAPSGHHGPAMLQCLQVMCGRMCPLCQNGK